MDTNALGGLDFADFEEYVPADKFADFCAEFDNKAQEFCDNEAWVTANNMALACSDFDAHIETIKQDNVERVAAVRRLEGELAEIVARYTGKDFIPSDRDVQVYTEDEAYEILMGMRVELLGEDEGTAKENVYGY